jgi:hypothetical protein
MSRGLPDLFAQPLSYLSFEGHPGLQAISRGLGILYLQEELGHTRSSQEIEFAN